MVGAVSLLVTLSALADSASALKPEQKDWLCKGKRFERAGWIYLHIEGEPRERGFQHSYLLAKEINDSLIATHATWKNDNTME